MIHLEDVTVTYPGGFTALYPTNIAFKRGEVTVLLGPSGAGKSTLLRTLNGLTPPTDGRICVEGFGELAMRSGAVLRRHRRHTGMIFQQHQLIGRLSALRNVLNGRLSRYATWRSLLPMPSADIAIALQALDRVGVGEKSLSRVDNLSGGQQQRVGIARALAQEPTLLLADEPVASLDPASSERVLSLLRRVCKEDGLCAVVSLHQVEFAKTHADRIVGLGDGRVVFDGLPGSLDADALRAIYHYIPGEAADQPAPEKTDELATVGESLAYQA